MTPDRARHYVCILIPLVTLLVVQGCAGIAVEERDCGMAPTNWSAPVARSGEVTLSWRVDPEQVRRNCGENKYGCAKVRGNRADVWLADERRGNCAVMKLAHELGHTMGAKD